jgi:hypothetical protein
MAEGGVGWRRQGDLQYAYAQGSGSSVARVGVSASRHVGVSAWGVGRGVWGGGVSACGATELAVQWLFG